MALNTTDENRPTSALFQELIEAILDHLHSERETLKSCALVSKSFLTTSQRHLFSTFHISATNLNQLVKHLRSFNSTDSRNGKAPSQTGIAHLLNTHTTELIFLRLWSLSHYYPVDGSFPKFPNVRRIVFKEKTLSRHSLPRKRWGLCFSGARSVEFNFDDMEGDWGILTILCSLPKTIENINFTATQAAEPYSSISIPKNNALRILGVSKNLILHDFKGTLTLKLACHKSHAELLSKMLKFQEAGIFKFSLRRINYYLTRQIDIPPLASLVKECEASLEFLDIECPNSRTCEPDIEVSLFDFSQHHVLRNIKVQIPLQFDPKWFYAAISSIPIPSSANPRVSPLRIELHVSLPRWMVQNWDVSQLDVSGEVDRMVNYWIPIDNKLWCLVGHSPGAQGITLDVSVTNVSTGPGNGIAALMFPVLSHIEGIIRLV